MRVGGGGRVLGGGWGVCMMVSMCIMHARQHISSSMCVCVARRIPRMHEQCNNVCVTMLCMFLSAKSATDGQ